jgi:hypothetical protein
MISHDPQSQLAPYFEAEMRKYGKQIPEKGYSGMGYWYYGYPAYIGAMSMGSGLTTAMPREEQAQPEPDSKIASVAYEAGATSGGQAMGESGVSPA